MIAAAELIRLPFFEGLSADIVETLARGAAARRFRRGQMLWRAGDEPRGLFVVLEGEVRVVRERDGRQAIIHAETAGGTLGEVPLWAGGTYPATAIAIAPTRCLAISRERLVEAMTKHPGLAPALLGRLAGRVRELVGRVDHLALLHVRARVAEHLLRRAEMTGSSIVTVGSSQAVLAEELGTVREVVVRALRQLVQAELLASLGGGRYRIVDAAQLRRAGATRRRS